MRGRDAALAAMAAIAGFLIVGVVVTEASADAVEFSLFVGLPAGLVAGFVAFVAVYRGLASPGRARRGSLAAGAFGTAFLLLVVLAAAGLGVRNTVALVVAAVGGSIMATAVYARTPL